jgi:hypothetical protein
MMPRFTVDQVAQKLETTFPTASAAVKTLHDKFVALDLS